MTLTRPHATLRDRNYDLGNKPLDREHNNFECQSIDCSLRYEYASQQSSFSLPSCLPIIIPNQHNMYPSCTLPPYKVVKGEQCASYHLKAPEPNAMSHSRLHWGTVHPHTHNRHPRCEPKGLDSGESYFPEPRPARIKSWKADSRPRLTSR